MKSLFLGLVVLFGLASTAMAARSESFRETCRIRYEDYRRVQADCLDNRGWYRYNDVWKSCRGGDLANINGQISCVPAYGPGPGYNLPPGSYLQSCHSCLANSATLSCQCLDMQQQYRYTSINYNYCRSEIANINGILSCSY